MEKQKKVKTKIVKSIKNHIVGKDVNYTTRDTYVCDQGHYGCSSCGNCGADVEGIYDKCPKCGYYFSDSKISYNEGGSDF